MDATSQTEWINTTIGDVIDIFDFKRIPISGSLRKQRQGPYPYYEASGVIDYIDDYIFDGRYLLIAEDGENLNSRKLPVAFFAQGKFWVNNHAHIVLAKAGIADDHFLFSWFDQANISGYITGAAQPKLSQENLKRIELRLPPLPTQRKIVAILSIYDDLIENNLRRIKILEEMAQNLYREWFVKFRFPGHQNIRFVDSPLGRIPEGWEVKRLDQVVLFQNKGTVAGEHLSDRVYLPIDCIPRKSLAISEINTWREAQSSLHLFDEGDILFGAMRPYFHKVVVAPFKGVTRKTCFVFKSWLPEYHAFAALTLFQNSTVSFANAHSKGATIPYAVWPQSMDGMPVIVPANKQAKGFEIVVGPMIARIGTMFFQNTTLRRTRDLLLPRLISGEVDVSELDIAVPSEADA